MPYTVEQMLEGLEPGVITSVKDAIKANSTKLDAKLFIDGDGEHFVPAARLSEVSNERNQLRTTLTEQKTKIDSLDALTKDNTAAQTTIAELNTQLANQSNLTKQSAIIAQLASKVTDSVAPATDLFGFLNADEITVKEDGSVIGLDEQVTKVRESRKYLFKEVIADPNGKPISKGTGDPGTNGLGGSGAGTSPTPKAVGELGKSLAQKAVQAKPTENLFWK